MALLLKRWTQSIPWSATPASRRRPRQAPGAAAPEQRRRLKEAEELIEKIQFHTRKHKYAEAIATAREVVAIRKDILGEQNRPTPAAWFKLADLLELIKEYTEAEPLYKQAVRSVAPSVRCTRTTQPLSTTWACCTWPRASMPSGTPLPAGRCDLQGWLTMPPMTHDLQPQEPDRAIEHGAEKRPRRGFRREPEGPSGSPDALDGDARREPLGKYDARLALARVDSWPPDVESAVACGSGPDSLKSLADVRQDNTRVGDDPADGNRQPRRQPS